MTILLDGKNLSSLLLEDLEKKIFNLHSKPRLHIIQLGNNSESNVYVNMKKKKCEKIGIEANVVNLDESTTSKALINLIENFNSLSEIHGIMVQLPLPKNLQPFQREILDTISPLKDVDGLTSHSLGKLVSAGSLKLDSIDFFISSTVYGVIRLIEKYEIDVIGKNVGIIGNSALVGMPLSIILSGLGGTVDICHIHTKDLKSHLIDKDVVISCCGVKGLVKGDMVKEGVIIIDVGISVEMVDGKKKIFGDCEKDSVMGKSSMMTPVPGGVGPMTIASLLEQTYRAFEWQQRIKKNQSKKIYNDS